MHKTLIETKICWLSRLNDLAGLIVQQKVQNMEPSIRVNCLENSARSSCVIALSVDSLNLCSLAGHGGEFHSRVDGTPAAQHSAFQETSVGRQQQHLGVHDRWANNSDRTRHMPVLSGRFVPKS